MGPDCKQLDAQLLSVRLAHPIAHVTTITTLNAITIPVFPHRGKAAKGLAMYTWTHAARVHACIPAERDSSVGTVNTVQNACCRGRLPMMMSKRKCLGVFSVIMCFPV